MGNPFDATLQKLVNIDDITSPTDISFQLSMNSNPLEEQIRKKEAISKVSAASATTIPSASYQPSLAEIRSFRPDAVTAPKDPIMQPPPSSVPSTTAPMVPPATSNGTFGGYPNHQQLKPLCDYPPPISHPMSFQTNARYYPSQQQPQQLYGSRQP